MQMSMSLHSKLVPVQYRECELRVFVTLYFILFHCSSFLADTPSGGFHIWSALQIVL